jgi:hypothetical protein
MSRLTATRISRSQASKSYTRRIGSKRQKRQADSPVIHPLLQMQQTHGNHAVGRLIQAQLKVSQPGDQYEQEADRVAEQVVDGQNSTTSRPAAISSNSQGPSMQRMPEIEDDKNELKKPDEMAVPAISRMPEGEEDQILNRKPAEGESEEEMPPTLQTKPAPNASPLVKPSVASNINRMQGGGKYLPKPVRAYFEPRMGADFSQVRVHTDSHAADTAKSINARAFTVGRNIAFGAGEYSPDTASGKKLLAHELAHVVQQKQDSASIAKRSLLVQRQPDEPPGPPDLPDPLVCSFDPVKIARLFSGDKMVALEIINCCNTDPKLAICTADILEAARTLLKLGELRCLEPFEPGTGKFTGLCCEKQKRDTKHCCSNERINFVSGRCCPPGTFFDGVKCKSPNRPPVPTQPCPLSQQTILGECCFPPLVPQGLRCGLPTPKPPIPPLPPPAPFPSAMEIFFQKDKPAQSASGSDNIGQNLTRDGANNFADLVTRLHANSELKVQLVGRASPEGKADYNLDLGRRRAEIIAQELERKGIDPTRITDPQLHELRSECLRVRAGIFTCGKAGATGPSDRQVLARVFRSE